MSAAWGRVGLSWDFETLGRAQAQPVAVETEPEAAPTTPTAAPLAASATATAPAAAAPAPIALTLSASPKLYNPKQDRGGIVFTVAAQGLSQAASSRLTITDPDNVAVAQKVLAGLPASFSWDGHRKGKVWGQSGLYSAALTVWDAAGATLASAGAGFGLEMGAGTVVLSPPMDVFAPLGRSTRPAARVTVIADGVDPQRWTLSIRKQGEAAPLRVISGRQLPAQLSWDGTDRGRRRAADGLYGLTLEVLTASGVTLTAQSRVMLDTRRPQLSLLAEPRIFKSGGEGKGTTLALGHQGEGGIARWSLRLESLEGRPLRVFSGTGVPPGSVVWDGADSNGAPVNDGSLYYAKYTLEMVSGALAELPRLALASRLDEPKLPFRVPLATVHFQTGDETVPNEELPVLKEAAAAVKKYNSDYTVLVLGHAEAGEAAGRAEGEIELSFLRAKAVQDFLADNLGLDRRRVKVSGLGDSAPAPGGGTTDRQRRAEVILYVQ
jgi:outer membrane protein OmpA-like peptidoglycan-associated protein